MAYEHVVAVIVVAIGNIFFSMGWFSDYLFGRTWRDELGVSFAEHETMRDDAQWKSYIITGFSSVITAAALAILVGLTQIQTMQGAALLGGLVWSGFTANTMLGALMWENKSIKHFLIKSAQQLISIVGSAIVLYAWLFS